jgi:hypothetical protein
MRIALAFATLLVAWVAAPVFAEDGRVSQSTLAAMGLGGMEQLSDAQGKQVRGEGLMFLYSSSTARIGTNPGSTDTAVFQGAPIGWQLETGAAADTITSITILGVNIGAIATSQTSAGYARGRAW